MIQFEKLVGILKKNPDEIKSKSKEELKAQFGEEFAEMKDYDQKNPYHDRDLLTHTIDVVKNLEIKEDNLLAAAFFHDIGKPSVCALKFPDKPDDENNWHIYHGHADKSAELAARILPQTGLTDEKQTGEILFYIENHDAFLNVNDTEKSVMRFIRKKINRAKDGNGFIPGFEEFIRLLSLCEADDKSKRDEIIKNGEAVDSKEKKLEKLKTVREIIENNRAEIR